jgi:hypothetical protein
MNQMQDILNRPLSGREVAYVRNMRSLMLLESFEIGIMHISKEYLEDLLRRA